MSGHVFGFAHAAVVGRLKLKLIADAHHFLRAHFSPRGDAGARPSHPVDSNPTVNDANNTPILREMRSSLDDCQTPQRRSYTPSRLLRMAGDQLSPSRCPPKQSCLVSARGTAQGIKSTRPLWCWAGRHDGGTFKLPMPLTVSHDDAAPTARQGVDDFPDTHI